MMYPWLLLLICLPSIGAVFVTLSKNEKTAEKNENVRAVGMLTIASCLLLIWHIFSSMDLNSAALQLSETYVWIENPELKLSFGVDVFSMMLLLGVHLAFLIAFWAADKTQKDMKYLMILSLCTLGMLNGFFVSADMFSFCIFFQAMLFPILLLTGMFGEIKRDSIIFRFFIYSILSAMLLFIATMLIYSLERENISLNNIQNLQLTGMLQLFVWGGILISFLSRIPIWPFHYVISSVASSAKNPVVFIIIGILPLTGLYGFVRFWPNAIPFANIKYTYILEIISLVTMLFIALIGMVNKDHQYKLFSYMTVFYMLYLQGVLLPTNVLISNISYSIFSYLLITSSICAIGAHVSQQNGEMNLEQMPKAMFLLAFMILAAIGLPLSSLFLNNFIIIAEIFNHSLYVGIFTIIAIFITAVSLLVGYYQMKDIKAEPKQGIKDISITPMLIVISLLIMSFINPLWFVK